jgi:exodeoxyribonuclease VII large subunit
MAAIPTQPSPELPLLTVSQLTDIIRDLIEGALPAVWVCGEISNYRRPQSGHCYFTLKDDAAQIRAVLWRSAAARVRCDLHDGLEVICRGRLGVYASQGAYQLVVEQIEPKGLGALELALRRLRQRLADEGLFDSDRKRPLPRFPRRVAFVTSPTGAAVRDFLQVLARRWRGVDVLIIPARVQGLGAAEEIAAGIRLANSLPLAIDVLVVGRGGGSLEDLWAFNEEAVARAIHGSRIPVISAVGHEIDVTLADLAADVRALTPSEAAERVAPSADDLRAALRSSGQRLRRALQRRAAEVRRRLDAIAHRRPFRQPLAKVHDLARQLDALADRIQRAAGQRLRHARHQAAAHTARLESLSPLGVLARGYSLTQRSADGALVVDAAQLAIGDQITSRFARGQAVSRVESTTER